VPLSTNANDYFSPHVSQPSQTEIPPTCDNQISTSSHPIHSRNTSTSSKIDKELENISREIGQMTNEKREESNELKRLKAENKDLQDHKIRLEEEKKRIEEEKKRIEEENRTLKEKKEVVKSAPTKSSTKPTAASNSRNNASPVAETPAPSGKRNQNSKKSIPRTVIKTEELDNLRNELSTIKSRNEELTSQNETLTTEREKLEIESKKMIKELNDVLNNKDEIISSRNEFIKSKQESEISKDQKIAELNGQIKRLNREREGWKIIRKEEQENYEKRISSLKQDLDVIKGQKTVLENDKELLQEQLRANRDEIGDTYEKIIKYERNSSSELKKEKDKLSTQLTEAQKRNKKLEEELVQNQADKKADEEQLAELTTKLSTAEKNIAELQKNITEIEKRECAECKNKNNEIAELKTEKGNFGKNIRRKNAEIKNLTTERDNLKNQVDEAKAENNLLTEQAAAQKTAIEDLKKKLADDKKSIDGLEEINKELSSRLTQNDETKSDLEQKNSELKSSLEEAEGRCEIERTRADNLALGKKELEKLSSERQTEIDNLKNELNNSAITIREVVEDRKTIVFEKAALASEINSLKAQIKNIENRKISRNWNNISPGFTPEIKKQWKEKGFSREECSDWINIGLKPNKADYAAWLRDVKRVNSDWVLDYGNAVELWAEYSKYLVEKSSLTVDNLNKLREEFGKKEEELTHTKENYRSLQENFKKLKGELTDSRETRKRNEETIKDLQAKIAEKEGIIMDRAKKQGAEVELLETLTSERNEWRTKYEAAISSAQTNQREAQNIQEELSGENAELKAQTTAQQAENNQLNNDVRELEEKLFVLGRAAEALLEQHRQQEQDWKKTQYTNEYLTKKNKEKQKELTKIKEDLEAAEILLDVEKNSFAAQQDKIKELRGQLLASQAEQRTLQRVNEELSQQKDKEITKLRSKLEAVENSLADYQTALKTKNKEWTQSQAELENLKRRYQKELNSSQQNQTWLEEQLEQLRKDVINELAAHSKTKQSLQKQIAQLERERDARPNTSWAQYAKLQKNLKTQLDQKNKDIKKLSEEKEQAEEKMKDWKKIACKKEEKIAKKGLAVREKSANLKISLSHTQTTIRNVRLHLKVKNLRNLPTMPQNSDGTSKSLKQLINDFYSSKNQFQSEKIRADNYENDIRNGFNITNANDWKNELDTLKKRPSSADYDNIKNERDLYQQERDNYKNELDAHNCSIVCQQPCCLGDYERLQNKLSVQEKEIFRKMNNSLKLGLESQELTLEKIITKIEELIRNPLTDNQKLRQKLVRAKKTIKLLQKQLGEKDPDYTSIQQVEYQKILKLMKNDTWQSCKKLGINIPLAIKENIEKATTLEAVWRERNKLVQGKLTKNGEELKMITQQKDQLIKKQNHERWIWVSFLLISYLITFGLLVRLNKKKRIK
jgi:chromosome segregation ATPase